MLPVEAQSTALASPSSALATATTMPLSLKDPVGLADSSLKYNSRQPARSDNRRARTSGVSPSPMEISGVSDVNGNRSP